MPTGWPRVLYATACVMLAVTAQDARAKPISEATDNAVLVGHFNDAVLRLVLQPIDIEHQMRRASNGSRYAQARIENILVNMYFTACAGDAERCLGLYLVSYWNAPNGRGAEELADSAANFNRRYDFIKSGLTQQGNPFVARYIIADYGVTRGNVRSEINNFVRLATAFRDEVINN